MSPWDKGRARRVGPEADGGHALHVGPEADGGHARRVGPEADGGHARRVGPEADKGHARRVGPEADGSLARRVSLVQRWLTAIYRLDLAHEARRFVIAPERARALLPPRSPRSGVLVVEEGETLWLGVYWDRRDRRSTGALVEEISHWVCLAWHAAHGRRVSRLLLELQGEVDQYAVSRLQGGDALRHFRRFRWDGWMGAEDRERYEVAHRSAHRYCRALSRRYPRRRDTPDLLRELRAFYRAPGEAKLRAS